MATVRVPIPIRVKDGFINIEEDNIQLEQSQVNRIKRQALQKTKKEWEKAQVGVKINLTTHQQNELVKVKDQVLEFLSSTKNPKEILQQKGFGFSHHAFERILERVERLSEDDLKALGTPLYRVPVYPETLEKIVKSLIDSKIAHSEAEWTGYPYLNFKFICILDDRELELIVNFEMGIFVITLIIKKEAGYYVREVYSFENEQPHKKPSPY